MPDSMAHRFETTRWSVILRAAGADNDAAQKALSEVCTLYWFPLYAYFRRSGKTPPDAEDLTQGFFLHLLNREILTKATPDKGRLRTYLLSCARNFLLDEIAHKHALKRGAGLVVQMDAAHAENLYTSDGLDFLTPDRLFQRRWAMTILSQSLQLLADEYASAGQSDLFEMLRPFLGFGPDPDKCYDALSSQLAIPVGTLKNKVFRLRERWRKLLFEQVAFTLDDPTQDNIKAELTELLGSV